MSNRMKLKQLLYDRCVEYVNQRVETAQQAISIAQASANQETKSSAGDKYETGRAMMQLEVERNTHQLTEALKLKQVLDQLNPNSETPTVQQGSLVTTNHGNFYLAISIGQLAVNDRHYFAISPASPIGAKLMNGIVGTSFVFNGKNYTIEAVR